MVAPLPEEGWNETIKAHVVTVTEHWVVCVTPMIYNDRVLLCSVRDWDTSIVAGFCYDKGAVAAVAALIWDPETQHEPLGHKKVAFDSRKGRLL